MIDIITFLLGWTSGLFVGLAIGGYLQNYIRFRRWRTEVAVWTDFFEKSGFIKILIDYLFTTYDIIPSFYRRGLRVGVHPSSSSTENPVRQESCEVPPTNGNSNPCPRRNAETSSPLVDIISPIVNIASLFGIRLPPRPASTTSNTTAHTSSTSNTTHNSSTSNTTPTISTTPNSSSSNTIPTTSTTPNSSTSNTTTTAQTSPFGNINPTTPTKNVETPQGNAQEVSIPSEEGSKNNPNVPNSY